MIEADTALVRLKKGNKQFYSNTSKQPKTYPLHRHNFLSEQTPFAIILGCSDSRVPVEIIFSQELGALFTIRIAGNIVTSSQIGSIELAAEGFGVRLIVVLGHSHCGAINATIEAISGYREIHSPNLQVIINEIQPNISKFVSSGNSIEETIDKSVKANINASVDKLRQNSEILQKLIDKEGLRIVGAEYCLASGQVDFLD